MKFSQFMSYSIGNNLNKKFYKICGLETSSKLFFCLQEIKHNLYWKMEFFKKWTYIRYVQANLIKISPNQHAGFLRLIFIKDPLKIQKRVWN